MHGNNLYLMQAQAAQAELKVLKAKAQELFRDNCILQRNHLYALKVVEEMGTTLQSRRHRLATWLGRLIGGPEMKPGALDAMLIGIRTALAAMPVPSPPSAVEQAEPEAAAQEPAAAPEPPVKL